MKTKKIIQTFLLCASIVTMSSATNAQEVPNNNNGAPTTNEQKNSQNQPVLNDPNTVMPMSYERLPCPFPMKLWKGSFETVQLGRYYYLDQIMIQMRGRGDLEVIVNGVSKKYIKVKGRTSAVINIQDRTNVIIFRHAGNGLRIKIKKIEIMPCRIGTGYGCVRPMPYPVPCNGKHCNPYPYPVQGSVTDAIYGLQNVLYTVTDFVTADEIAAYVSPIRAQAGRTLSIIAARGELSSVSKEAVLKLIAMLEAAQSWTEKLKSAQHTYELGVEIEFERELLKNWVK